MLSAIIIDDLERDRNQLKEQLVHFSEVELIGEFGSAASGMRAIEKDFPQLVFLDVQMPGMTGLQMLEKMDYDPKDFAVLFTTSFDRFAVQAFKLACWDFLTKPIQKERLGKSLERVNARLHEQYGSRQFDILRSQFSGNTSTRKIAIPTEDTQKGRHLMFIDVDDIVCCEAVGKSGGSGNYTTIHVKGDESSAVLASKALKHFEELLSPYGLVRVHRSSIVNPAHMSAYDGNDVYVLLGNREKPISVSKGYKARFEEILTK